MFNKSKTETSQGYERDFVWATNEYGKPVKCNAKPENRGKGNCHHYYHQKEGETLADFLERAKKENQARIDATNDRLIARVDVFKEKMDSLSELDTENGVREIVAALGTFTKETRTKMATSDTMDKVDAAVVNFNEVCNYTLDKTRYFSSHNRAEIKKQMSKYVDEINNQRFMSNVSINDLYGDPDVWISRYEDPKNLK